MSHPSDTPLQARRQRRGDILRTRQSTYPHRGTSLNMPMHLISGLGVQIKAPMSQLSQRLCLLTTSKCDGKQARTENILILASKYLNSMFEHMLIIRLLVLNYLDRSTFTPFVCSALAYELTTPR